MNVSLTEQEWTTLLNAVALAPYSQVAPLIAKVTDQLIKQQQQMNVPAEAPETKSGA